VTPGRRRATAPVRRLAAALAVLLAGPALAYVLPPAAVVKKASEKRAALDVSAVEAAGTLELRGPALARLGALAPPGGAPLTVPARLLVRNGGKARLELLPPDLAEADRPRASVKDDKLSGQGGLDATPAAAALLRALAALLGSAPGNEGKALGEALVRRGVKLDDATLGRFNGRIALVLGGRTTDRRPLAYLDKETFMPLRLVTAEGAGWLDVRLIDWSSPTGGDWFPRAIEVWDGAALLLRFTTERAVVNPKPDAGF
jgi:hypothetical protein